MNCEHKCITLPSLGEKEMEIEAQLSRIHHRKKNVSLKMRSLPVECLGINPPRLTKFLYGEISTSLLADLKGNPDKYL